MMAMELKLLRLEARLERRPEATPTTGRLSSQRASILSPAVRSPPAPPTPETLQQPSIRPRSTYPNQQHQKRQAQNSNNNNNVTEQVTPAAELSSRARLVLGVTAGSSTGVEGEDREDDVGSQQSSKFKTLSSMQFFGSLHQQYLVCCSSSPAHHISLFFSSKLLRKGRDQLLPSR
jgi:type IV secretory pathway VirB10-like protein